LGVSDRNFYHRLILETILREPSVYLEEGLRETYFWIEEQIQASRNGFEE